MSIIKTSIKVYGLSEVTTAFNKKKDLKDEFDIVIEDIVKDTCSLIRRYCPVDTGEMMESIYYEKNSQCHYTIHIDTGHVLYNEFGTKYMPAGTTENPLAIKSTSGKSAYRPFIRPSIWIIRQIYDEYFKKIEIKFKY
jgi:hypothetical protein